MNSVSESPLHIYIGPADPWNCVGYIQNHADGFEVLDFSGDSHGTFADADAAANVFYDWWDREFRNGGGDPVPVAEPDPQPEPARAGVPFLITRAQKEQLRTLGFSEAQISEMTPGEAHGLLGVKPVDTAPIEEATTSPSLAAPEGHALAPQDFTSSGTTSDPLTIARGFIERGWNPIPVSRQTKKPIGYGWQHRRLTEETVAGAFNRKNMNVGVQSGPMSNGLTDTDLDCREAVLIGPMLLPASNNVFGRASKRRSHWLYSTTLADKIAKACLQFKDTGGTMMLELKIGGGGKGTQSVFPGSTHTSGEAIGWERDGVLVSVDDDTLLRQVRRLAVAVMLARHWPAETARHDAALTVGGFLARAGFDEDAAALMLEAIATAAGDEEVPDRAQAARDAGKQYRNGGETRGFPALVKTFDEKVAGKAAEWLGYKPHADFRTFTVTKGSTSVDEVAPTHSEEALALAFAERHADTLRHVAKWGRWLVWDGTCWRVDETRKVFSLARDLCRKAANSADTPDECKRIASAKTRAAVVSLASEDRQLAATIEQWDADPWLLNTPGGVVDLRTGQLREHRITDYMTKQTTVTPTLTYAEASCPRWKKFMQTVTGGDSELQRYLQRVSGYCLTGVTIEQELYFFYGSGNNGKGVWVKVIAGVLGDYHRPTPIETFTVAQSERHPTDMAGLVGVRLVTASETEEGRRWSEARIKEATGGDEISARFMRQDFFDFFPLFKLLFSGNHMPKLRTVNKAIIRRFNRIPFAVTIPDDQVNKNLADELLAQEGPGILAWAIEGCLEWQRIGMCPPQAVADSTESYLESEDVFGEWIDECCIRDANAWESSTRLFGSWKGWAVAREEWFGSEKDFVKKLEDRGGFKKQKNKEQTKRGFAGLRLKTKEELAKTNTSAPPAEEDENDPDVAKLLSFPKS